MPKYNSILDAIYHKIDSFIERGIVDESAKLSTISECLNKIAKLSLDDIHNPEAAGILSEEMNDSDMVISDQLALVLEAYANSIGSNKYEDSDVRFIGMNGDIIYGYSKDEFLALTQMPPNPKVEGFTSQGWNWDIEDAQAYVAKYDMLDVGQMYIPADGKTHMIVDLKERLTIPLIIQQTVSEGVTINWGDGSEEETIEGTGVVTTSHTYESEGEYEITLDVADGCELNVINGSSSTNITESSDYIKSIAFGNGITALANYAFSFNKSLERVVIPFGITTIGSGCFSYCFSLHSITIPKGITELQSASFRYCNPSRITIPNGVTSIGPMAFQGCTSVDRIIIPNTVTTIQHTVFKDCISAQYIIIPESVSLLSSAVFENCNSVKKISIPNNVTSIESTTFESCYNLEELVLPEELTVISSNAFSSCYHLYGTLKIPDKVTSIQNASFQGCTSLSKIIIGKTVGSLGNQTFGGCRALQELYLLPTTPPTITAAMDMLYPFAGISSDCAIYVPYSEDHSILNAYKTDAKWSKYASQIQELPE